MWHKWLFTTHTVKVYWKRSIYKSHYYTIKTANHYRWTISIPASYSRGPGFHFQPRVQLRLGLLWFSSVPPGKFKTAPSKMPEPLSSTSFPFHPPLLHPQHSLTNLRMLLNPFCSSRVGDNSICHSRVCWTGSWWWNWMSYQPLRRWWRYLLHRLGEDPVYSQRNCCIPPTQNQAICGNL
jgi:hypothetical protein